MSDVSSDVVGWSHAELVAFVVTLSQRVATLEAENAEVRSLRLEVATLQAENAALKSKGSKNSGKLVVAVVS